MGIDIDSDMPSPNCLLCKCTVINTNLHLNALTVDKFDRRHNGVEQHGALLAWIKENAVDFSFDGDGGIFAFENVDHIVHFSIFDQQIWIGSLMFDEPFLAVACEYWRLGHSGSSWFWCRRLGVWCFEWCRTRAQCSILVRLHFGRDTFQAWTMIKIELVVGYWMDVVVCCMGITYSWWCPRHDWFERTGHCDRHHYPVQGYRLAAAQVEVVGSQVAVVEELRQLWLGLRLCPTTPDRSYDTVWCKFAVQLRSAPTNGPTRHAWHPSLSSLSTRGSCRIDRHHSFPSHAVQELGSVQPNN